jgi:tripartite-type tricarboxylate transporter receptor subunit TctC
MALHLARLAAAALIAGSFFAPPSLAQQSAETFYKGRQMSLLIGFAAGGGYDAYSRLVARHLGNHIPGHPTIVPQYMPGGGGRILSRYVYNSAPKDGSVIATADQSLVFQQALGDNSLYFDCQKFNWIGNTDVDNNVVFTWFKSGVKTLADAKKQAVPLAATTANTTAQAYPAVLNAMIGTKFKIVAGYPGGNDANMAMENGEIAGRGASSWANLKVSKPTWIRDKKVNILVQIGLRKATDLPDIPLLLDLAKNDSDRAALQLLSAPIQIGRPLFTSPGVPTDRVEILRKAFDDTMQDPDFLNEAKSMHVDVNPLSGVELQKVVTDIVATPKAAVDRLTSIIGASGQ